MWWILKVLVSCTWAEYCSTCFLGMLILSPVMQSMWSAYFRMVDPCSLLHLKVETSGSRWAPPEQLVQPKLAILQKCLAAVGEKPLIGINSSGWSLLVAPSFPKVLPSSCHYMCLHCTVHPVFGTDDREGPGQDGDQMWAIAVRIIKGVCCLLVPEKLLNMGWLEGGCSQDEIIWQGL